MIGLDSASLQFFGLQARLALARIGWSAAIAGMLWIVGGAGLLWFVPHLRVQAELQQRALTRMQKNLHAGDNAVPIVRASLAEERMAKFYAALGEKHYAEQQVKTLFALAEKTGLALSQAEYKSAYDKNSNTHTYKIQLPLKGPYPAIRQFCELTLRAIPFASLDEMSFKRDAVGSPALEAKLRFTLYLAAAPAMREKNEAPQ